MSLHKQLCGITSPRTRRMDGSKLPATDHLLPSTERTPAAAHRSRYNRRSGTCLPICARMFRPWRRGRPRVLVGGCGPLFPIDGSPIGRVGHHGYCAFSGSAESNPQSGPPRSARQRPIGGSRRATSQSRSSLDLRRSGRPRGRRSGLVIARLITMSTDPPTTAPRRRRGRTRGHRGCRCTGRVRTTGRSLGATGDRVLSRWRCRRSPGWRRRGMRHSSVVGRESGGGPDSEGSADAVDSNANQEGLSRLAGLFSCCLICAACFFFRYRC